MAIYKCSGEVEPGTTRIKFNEWSERVLNPGSPDLKASALNTGPHCLRDPSDVFPISIDDIISALIAWSFVQTVSEKMASDRFVKFSEAGVKSFSDQKQENANTKNKTSLRYNLKLFKEFLANEEEMR